MSTTRKLSLKEEAELAAGATGAVVATDQITKSLKSKNDQLEHLVRAGIGAAVAIGAYEMLRRGGKDDGSRTSQRRHSASSNSSRQSSSSSSNPSDHNPHMVEEIIGAYPLGKELLGDKHHHIRHLVGEAIGATGLLQEVREKEKHVVLEEKGYK
jgi:hypothetical protein